MKERWLFVSLVVLTLVPFWAVARVPTVDGPCHLYNAWIVQRLALPGGDPGLAQAFTIDWRPMPNWLGHAALALLMVPFSPATAEKILVTGYAVLFLLAARYLAGAVDPQRRWLAWLAFPFVYNQMFQFGFYNFCASLGFFMLALGYWWRRRATPDRSLALGINGILLLCYFSHILSTVLALSAIGVLWLFSLRAAPLKRHLLHVPILAPQAVLPLWFTRGHSTPIPSTHSMGELWRYLRRIEVLFSFGERQILAGSLLAALFLGLAVATLLCRGRPAVREEDGFLLLALLAVVLYFVSPEGMGGGTLIKPRLSLYPWLFLIPWLSPLAPSSPLSPSWGRPARAVLIAGLALFAAGNAAAHLRVYREIDRDVAAYLAAAQGMAPGIAPDTRVLPVLFDRSAAVGLYGLLGHAFDRFAIERRLVDWSDYEAASDLFPVRFLPELPRPTIYTLEATPGELDVEPYRDQIDYVFCWKVPADSALAARLLKRYARVAEQGPATLYERRTRVRARRARQATAVP